MPKHDKLVSDIFDAVEESYGGHLGCDDDLEHFVDTIAQYMGVPCEKVQPVIIELILDRSITLKERHCDECRNELNFGTHHPQCTKRFS